MIPARRCSQTAIGASTGSGGSAARLPCGLDRSDGIASSISIGSSIDSDGIASSTGIWSSIYSGGIDRPRDAGYHRVVHCSIWTWRGDPDDLAARYETMVASIPVESMRFSACAKVPDGIVVFDTCPSKSVFDEFSTSDGLRGLLAAHGLGAPESVVDGPAVVAFADGRRVDLD